MKLNNELFELGKSSKNVFNPIDKDYCLFNKNMQVYYIYIVKDEEATSELRIVNVFLVPIIQKNWVMFKKYYFGKNHK